MSYDTSRVVLEYVSEKMIFFGLSLYINNDLVNKYFCAN